MNFGYAYKQYGMFFPRSDLNKRSFEDESFKKYIALIETFHLHYLCLKWAKVYLVQQSSWKTMPNCRVIKTASGEMFDLIHLVTNSISGN